MGIQPDIFRWFVIRNPRTIFRDWFDVEPNWGGGGDIQLGDLSWSRGFPAGHSLDGKLAQPLDTSSNSMHAGL